MFRLGVVLGICALIGYYGYSTMPKAKHFAVPNSSTQLTKREYFKLAKSEVHWILPRIELEVVRICRGHLNEDFGFMRRVPKTIIFFRTKDGPPEIVTARVSNLLDSQRVPREINSRNLSDLNFYAMEKEGAYAEHGQLAMLQEFDQQNGTRRYDQLLEEASYLCTEGMASWDQRVIDMENIRDQIRREAGAYVALEWPLENRDARMDVFYEVEGRTFKAELALDF